MLSFFKKICAKHWRFSPNTATYIMQTIGLLPNLVFKKNSIFDENWHQ
jgi:hypothetical protein